MNMKRNIILSILLLANIFTYAEKKSENLFPFEENNKIKEKVEYKFSTTWRIEVSYTQDWQNSNTTSISYPDSYLHGGKIGVAVDFNLPYNFSAQTGLFYALNYTKNSQHWRTLNKENNQPEFLEHHIMKHTIIVPVHLTYTQKLWKELSLIFFTGPNFNIGIAQQDKISATLSEQTRTWMETLGIQLNDYDKYKVNELSRFNIQWTLGGGLQWANYRVQAGYDFGLNNLVKNPWPVGSTQMNAHMWEWSWFVGFSYAF